MRQIKFRAWSSVDREMFYPSSVSWKGDLMWICDTKGENKLEYEIVKGHSSLMQYTGLKDKNGKEIYEGDIVKLVSETTSIGEIKWQYGCFEYCGNNHMGNVNGYMPEYLEIIGNIYENKELLK